MNLSIPILICDENEEIRLLIKEMLTKHGYFHLMEAHSEEEILQVMKEEQFILIHSNLLSRTIKQSLHQRRNFLIVAQRSLEESVSLAGIFGVEHLISFPYTSKSLVEKINSLMR